MLHFVARNVAQLANQAWTLVPMLVATWSVGANLIVVGGAVLVAGIIGVAVLQHRAFRYRITGHAVEARSGVLHKRHVNLGFQRVQNVRIEQPFYLRPLNLVTLKMDGAGSSDDEVALAALSAGRARALQAAVLKERGAAERPQGVEAEVFARTPADLFIYGLTSNRVWVLSGAGGGFLSQFSERLELGEVTWLLGITVAALVVLLVGLLSAAGTLLYYWDYRLRDEDRELNVSFGLLTRRSVRLQKARVQAVMFQQNALCRLFGRVNLRIEQISHVQPGSQRGDDHIVVPAVTPLEAQRLVAGFAELEPVQNLDFVVPHPRYWRRTVGVLVTFYSGVALTLWFAQLALAPGALMLGVAHLAVAYLAYRKWGLSVREAGEVVVRRGVVGTNYVVIPFETMQNASVQTSPLTERLGLVGALKIRCPSRSERVPYLPAAAAWRAADGMVEAATAGRAAGSRAWMLPRTADADGRSCTGR